MKFIYINNALCIDCDRCVETCPTAAIYPSDSKRYINYDKCTVCGSCIKACRVDAVALETLENATREMERIDVYRSKIENMEQDQIKIRTKLRNLQERLSDVVKYTPVGMVIAESSLKIVVANSHIKELSGIDPLILSEMPEDLSGESLKSIFPADIVRLIRVAIADTGVHSYVAQIASRPVLLTVVVPSDESVLCILRDLSERAVMTEEVVARIKSSIEQQMSMVQKIGFLLGEEVSVVVNDLNTIIKTAESSGGDDK